MNKVLLHPKQLHKYQQQACLHQLYNPKSMLWLGMGLGKTIITLSTVEHRMKCDEVQKTLIIAPLRVIYNVWESEAKKWLHTKHLRFSVIHGTEQAKQRAMFKHADIYLTNYENLNWLAQFIKMNYIKQGLGFPFDFVVYDEITKVANSTSLRIKGGIRDRKKRAGEKLQLTDDYSQFTVEQMRAAGWSDDDMINGGVAVLVNDYQHVKTRYVGWREMIPLAPYTTGLTGTPAGNGYIDLHGQYLVIDNGVRLGKYISHFKRDFMQSDYMGWKYTATKEGERAIEMRVSDITIKMDTVDYLDMPNIVETDILVDLPDKVLNQYLELEQRLFTIINEGTEIELFTQSSLYNKLLQFCNGSVFTDLEGNWESVHDAKLDALDDIIQEAGGSPVLCSYSYKPDAERIMKKFKKLKPINISGQPASALPNIIKKWNNGKCRLLIGHPASMGHGIDGLQNQGHIVAWFGVNWSYQLYDQMNARLYRQGQNNSVTIARIMIKNSIDLLVSQAIKDKHTTQEQLKESIRQYQLSKGA